MNAFGEGKPGKLVADKGSEFRNGDLQALLKVEGIEWGKACLRIRLRPEG